MKKRIVLVGLIFILFCSFISVEGTPYRKAIWSWEATFDYFVNAQYSNDGVNWYDVSSPCTHVRFREEMYQQYIVWNDVGDHRYWALHVCGTGGTPPLKIWEMDWFTYDGTNYVENNPTADKISSEGSFTLFDASKLVDNDLDTLGLQRDNPGTSEARFIIDTQISSCTENWQCGAWSTCANGQQTRTCTDAYNCGTIINKPVTTQSCTCTESWNCGTWSSCIGGQQTRTCTDANNCGTIVNKPATTQSCTVACTESWTCTAWSNCMNGQQTRTCTDANNCGTIVNKPVTTQSCTCVESWGCSAWSSCVNDQQTRACTDINNCGTIINKPATTQSCIEACVPSWSCTSWSSCINNQKTRTCIDSKNCNNDQGKPIDVQNCIVDVNPPTSATPPNVIVNDVDGVVGGNDGRLVFEISNADSNHKIEGYLSCNIPSDVIVTSSVGAASGSQSQYVSQTFTIDSAPSMESMSLSLSSQSEGMKYVSCTVNYILYKEGKGYLTSNGQYSSEKKYFIINAGRDVSFNAKEASAKTPQETVKSSETIEIPKRVVWGVVVFVVLLLAFLLGRSSKSNQ